MPGLASQRLIFVTGKGGVGKSTVATALAMASARRGRRTLLAEISSRDRGQPTGAGDGHRAREVGRAPGLLVTSIDPELAMEEYLRIRLGSMGQTLASAKLFQTLMLATPGMREMQTMAKIWELAHPDRPAGGGDPYDVVIVDAPATGHAIGLLRTPLTFAELARVGPVAKGARLIAAMVADPAFTGVVAVATGEEMAVNETLSLHNALEADGVTLSAVVLNRLYPDRLTAAEAGHLEACLANRPGTVLTAARAALFQHRRATLEAAQAERITRSVSVPVISLPFVFADEFGHAARHTLADTIAEVWPADAGAAAA